MTVGALVPAARATRAKLMVLLPLTMALLVAGTGFFTLSIATRAYELHGPGESGERSRSRSSVCRSPASRSSRRCLDSASRLASRGRSGRWSSSSRRWPPATCAGRSTIASTSELDSLGGAVNDAISAIQRYYFQSMTGAVITLDADGRVIGSSPAAEATLGYREEDLVGRRFSEVFTPASGSRASLTAVETAIAGRKPVSLDDVEILAADGRPVRIGITASYLQQRTGSGSGRRDVVGVTIAFKDLNQMRSLRARLQQADQLVALGTVTAGVAHEIRNPLASLRGLTELLGRDIAPSDQRRKYIDTMLESIDRLNRLIEDLLLFSSPKAATTVADRPARSGRRRPSR